MKKVFILLFLVGLINQMCGNLINFRLIWTIPYSCPTNNAKCFDSDQDGDNNIVFAYGTLQVDPHIQFWEYSGFDRYQLEDTLAFIGSVQDIGYLDSDSLIDLLVMFHSNESLVVFEQTNPNVHPKNRVWQYGSNSINTALITDLDQDSRKEIVHSWFEAYINVLENVSDNVYQLVSTDTVYWSSTGNFATGDFDNDSRMDFATSAGYGYVSVFECFGDNDYQRVFCDTLPQRNAHDIFTSPDMDGNGKPEFLFGTFIPFTGSVHLWLYEMTGDNQYDFYLVDSVNIEALDGTNARSVCGDIDADGRNEIIWSSYDNWRVYKAIGISQYQRIFSLYPTGDWWARVTLLTCCDLNKNGYPEVVEAVYRTTNPAELLTRIWEIEGVRLHQPNGGETLNPSQQYPITWEKFTPPGADSFSLFFSADSGKTYDTIVTGLGANDTMYLWTVPNVISDSCKIMIWAYGPPRPGEQQPRGTAWDFSDSIFTISEIGVTEARSQIQEARLKILQNPVLNGHFRIQYAVPKPSKVRLVIYNVLGQVEQVLVDKQMPTGIYEIELNESLPSGVYFIQLTADQKSLTKKLIKIK